MTGDDDDFDSQELEANLFLDTDTRMWRLELQGPAFVVLAFLLDASDHGIAEKLWTEAKFDRLVKYDLGELND
jgi:hypothetical protein